MAFPCTKCGACCRKIGTVIDIVRARPDAECSPQDLLFREFPHPVDEQGVCSQYDPETGCKIYNDRPAVCNTDTMYRLFYSSLAYDHYVALNVQACGLLIDVLELDPTLKPRL